MQMLMNWDQDIDAIGLLCPLPVLKARKRLLAMKPGEVLRLVASDPAAVIDVPHFCVSSAHTLLAQTAADEAHCKLSPTGTAHFYFIKCG
jgi:tRNA 2-thiouridine synthesizing protein A